MLTTAGGVKRNFNNTNYSSSSNKKIYSSLNISVQHPTFIIQDPKYAFQGRFEFLFQETLKFLSSFTCTFFNHFLCP